MISKLFANIFRTAYINGNLKQNNIATIVKYSITKNQIFRFYLYSYDKDTSQR